MGSARLFTLRLLDRVCLELIGSEIGDDSTDFE